MLDTTSLGPRWAWWSVLLAPEGVAGHARAKIHTDRRSGGSWRLAKGVETHYAIMVIPAPTVAHSLNPEIRVSVGLLYS